MRPFLLVCAYLAFAACQTSQEMRPAHLYEQTPETLERMRSLLAQVLGRAEVEIGPVDLTAASVLPVLPPPAGPLEMNDLRMPRLFELGTEQGSCYLRDVDTGATYLLEGPDCRPA